MPPLKGIRRKDSHNSKRDIGSKEETKATTTPLVNSFFHSLFSDQMIKSNDGRLLDRSSVDALDDDFKKPCVVLLKKLEKENFSKTPNLNSKRRTSSSRKFMTALKENVSANSTVVEDDVSAKMNESETSFNSSLECQEAVSKFSRRSIRNVINESCEKDECSKEAYAFDVEIDLQLEHGTSDPRSPKRRSKKENNGKNTSERNNKMNSSGRNLSASDSDCNISLSSCEARPRSKRSCRMSKSNSTTMENGSEKLPDKPNLDKSSKPERKKNVATGTENGFYAVREGTSKNKMNFSIIRVVGSQSKVQPNVRKSPRTEIAQSQNEDHSTYTVVPTRSSLKKSTRKSINQTKALKEKLNEEDGSSSKKVNAIKSAMSSSIGDKSKPKRKSVKNFSFEMNELSGKNNAESNQADKKVYPLKVKSPESSKQRNSKGRKEDLNTSSKNKRKFVHDDDERVERTPNKVRKFTDKESRSSFKIDNESFRVGDFVTVRRKREIGRIKSIWRADDDQIMCHIQWFMRSADTILGDVGNPREIFQMDDCEDMNLNVAIEAVDVSRLLHTNWYNMGNSVLKAWTEKTKNNSNALFYQKRYDPKVGHFFVIPENEEKPDKCSSCQRREELKNQEIPIPLDELKFDKSTKQCTINAVRWRNQIFSVNTTIFLIPGSLDLPKPCPAYEKRAPEEYDETMYPEKYRKTDAVEDDSTMEEPFDIALISGMFSEKTDITKKEDVYVRVKKFYRPHNTHMTRGEANEKDLNLLYWSVEECVVTFNDVEGKCFVAYDQNLDISVDEWTSKGPHRFYFNEAFDRKTLGFVEPLEEAKRLGDLEYETQNGNIPVDWPEISRPLYMMDVFAGCGGLSEGLQQSGVAECRWAIEKFEKPAQAFQLNNELANVYVDDCIKLLKKIKKSKDAKWPRKGDVELLVGGPPCTGMSKMDHHSDGNCLSFENSLIGAFLSYCEYFRPRFVILENIRDFTSAAKGMIFKLSLSRLIALGYQVSFTVLQCGRYGIPQSRRRAIIFAAGPGEVLPTFPEPTHAFPLNKSIDINVGGKKFTMCSQWTSAPYRSITVADALSDLPLIFNDESREEMPYNTEPKTHFQAMVRGMNSQRDDVLTDHLCKRQNDLNWLRITYIPRKPVGDWRDLPNIEVELPDGTYANKLEYTHRDWKNGEASNGDFRGVCACASKQKGKCNKGFRQTNTLIPWCLPHTGNRHNNWSGLFGRLGWNGYFRTVVTNPEPMGKQGKVLHPTQNRVFSVRECARSQGFPDSFKFYGNILDKYNQIGNSFAPPLAKALGYEIKKCVAERA